MCLCVLKKWLEAIEAHSAFSTHYCSQYQGSEEDEDEVILLGELTESLQVSKDSVYSPNCLSPATPEHVREEPIRQEEENHKT